MGLSSGPVVVVVERCPHPQDRMEGRVTLDWKDTLGTVATHTATCRQCGAQWVAECTLQENQAWERFRWVKNMLPAIKPPPPPAPPKPVVLCKGCEKPLKDCTGSYRACAAFHYANPRHEAGDAYAAAQTRLSHVAGFQLRAPPVRIVVLADDNSEPV